MATDDDVVAMITELRATIEQQHRRITELEEALRTDAQAVDTPVEAVPADASAETDEPRMSRRRLLGVLGGSTAVAAGASVLAATPAAAAPNNPLVIGVVNDGGTTITSLNSNPTPNSAVFAATNKATNQPIGVFGQAGERPPDVAGGAGVLGLGFTQPGVAGFSNSRDGVLGQSVESSGVAAYSQRASAVFGQSRDGSGLQGVSDNFYGVSGTCTNTRAGVDGRSSRGPGVSGTSEFGAGVLGVAPSTVASPLPASGVVGQGSTNRGVTGTASTGIGVWAQSGGLGLLGYCTSATGLGAQFQGGRAQVWLVPSTTVTGAPTTGNHQIGELFLDKVGALYLCKTAGAPGTWKLLG